MLSAQHAACNGEWPTFEHWSTFAPLLMRNDVQSAWPFAHANAKAELPFSPVMLILTPRATNAVSVARLPASAASQIGFIGCIVTSLMMGFPSTVVAGT